MRKTVRVAAVLGSAVALWGGVIDPNAEPPPGDLGEFSADRPGFGVPTNVVPRGVLQFETGVSLTSEADPGGRTRTLTWGSPLVRVGVGKRTEIRIGGDGFLSSRVEDRQGTERVRGWSDVALGAKIALWEGRGLALSVVPTLSLPAGARAFTSSALDPSLVVAWSLNLPAKFSAGGTLGYASVSDGGGRLAQRTQAVSLGRALFGGFSGYAEAFTVSPPERGAGGTWMVNGGVTHAIGPNAQADVEFGRRVASGSDCWLVSVGFAVRTVALRHFGRFW